MSRQLLMRAASFTTAWKSRIEVTWKKMLSESLPTDPTIGYEHRLLSGAPAKAIVDLADAEGVEMIVLATHGRTGLTRLLMGSVAEAVVRKANCPVVTVKAIAPALA